MEKNEAVNIVLEEFSKIKNRLLEYQKQHEDIYGEVDEECTHIYKNLKLFKDSLLERFHGYQ